MLPIFARDLDPVTYTAWRPLIRQFDEMFDQLTPPARDHWHGGRSDHVQFEIDETDDHYVMSFDVPGVRREDLDIEVNGNRLTVSGERKAERKSGSRRYGKFQRVFNLPDGVTADGIVAEHKDGVLRLALQKPAAAKAMKIKIADGATQVRDGGFFKNLVSNKNAKNTVHINGASAKNDAGAIAN